MLGINMIANAVSYLVTFGINFFLSPYIVKTIGVEANGFVGLANNFVGYATLATVALNSLAGRFISIKIFEKDNSGANTFYSSVFFANCVIGFAILLVETYVWFKLETLVQIPTEILFDVKILFGALFLNCVVSTVGSVFGVATFATNRLYISALRSIESHAIRAFVLVAAFWFFAPHVWYLGATSLLAGLYCMFFNIHYMHVLLPDLKLSISKFKIKAVIELVSSGVWSLVNQLGQLLLDGLDLLITNIFIDATAMGVLSLSKTVPAMIANIIGSVAGVFSPNFTKLYAEKKMEDLVSAIKQSMRVMGVLANIPIIVLLVCGQHFFSLWQPTQDARALQILSVLTVGCSIISGGINSIYNVFTVVNKLKLNSLVIIGSGAISAAITYLLVKYTTLGVYAVAGTSTIIGMIRNFAFTVPYGAKCVGKKWYEFFPYIIRSVLFVLASVAICYPIMLLIQNAGWLGLVIKALITGALASSLGWFIVFGPEERSIIKRVVARRFSASKKQ